MINYQYTLNQETGEISTCFEISWCRKFDLVTSKNNQITFAGKPVRFLDILISSMMNTKKISQLEIHQIACTYIEDQLMIHKLQPVL